ncbi:MAG: hypothetical protein ACOX52_17335 [Verrucomicrobiota bacterium]
MPTRAGIPISISISISTMIGRIGIPSRRVNHRWTQMDTDQKKYLCGSV